MRRRDECVDRDETERRRCVNDDYVVLLPERLETILEPEWRVEITDEFRFEFSEIYASGNDVQVLDMTL